MIVLIQMKKKMKMKMMMKYLIMIYINKELFTIMKKIIMIIFLQKFNQNK